jgi:formate-dependent phosphoribosylglycinamide formyltransferase (GAR transformylase)
VTTKYAICPNCGFGIDVFTEADLKNLVREKRLKYLITRDQTCPNCIMTFSKCEEITADESAVPIVRATIQDSDKARVREFAKERQYVVVTDYTLSKFKEEVK